MSRFEYRVKTRASALYLVTLNTEHRLYRVAEGDSAACPGPGNSVLFESLNPSLTVPHRLPYHHRCFGVCHASRLVGTIARRGTDVLPRPHASILTQPPSIVPRVVPAGPKATYDHANSTPITKSITAKGFHMNGISAVNQYQKQTVQYATFSPIP